MQKRVVALVLLTFTLLSLTACQKVRQVSQLFQSRPGQHLPAYQPVANVMIPGQNWPVGQREWFYHTGQGTILLPYRWLLALEQPKFTLFSAAPKFSETSYLARFGFLPDAAGPQNPDGFPVGFARSTVVDPKSGKSQEIVGFTCAACHTGQVEYHDKAVRIDGGASSVDLDDLQIELGYAVAYTKVLPGRYARFEKIVLGENASEEAKQQLKQEFDAAVAAGETEAHYTQSMNLLPVRGGFGRTDALGRIGNFVFGTELDPQNYRVANAPVSVPPLWYASWFAWVQYNASIQQPMARNIGEAMGVRARVNLTDKDRLFQSTVNVKNLHEIEDLLAGPTAFSGLKAPQWPEQMLGPIDQAKAARGKQIYEQHCQHCHLPPLDSPEIQQDRYWEAGLEGRRFLKLNVIPLDEIGTDPLTATNFNQRTAVTGPVLGLGTAAAKDGLKYIGAKIAETNYAQLGVSPAEQVEWNGYREDNIVAPLAYRARPLSGMWATPPFLHNGSVPNLYQMLLPAEKRDKTFYTGSREFDPLHVGYQAGKFEGGFLFDTSQQGNSNAGHEFSNREGKGVIGPELTDEERYAIIEYLKTM